MAVQTDQVMCPSCQRAVATWRSGGLEFFNCSGFIGGTVTTLRCLHAHRWHKGRCGREIVVVMPDAGRQEMGGAA